MRELYSSEPNLVKFVTSVQGRPERPLAGPTVQLFAGNDKNDLQPVSILNANEIDNGEYEIPVPQHFLHQNKFASLHIKYELEEYGVFEQDKTFDIARRLMDFEELNDVLGKNLAIDYSTFTFIETDVRKIIESYCNQSFNIWYGKQRVEGADGHIILPEPLEQLEKVQLGSGLAPGYMNTVNGYVISEAGNSIFNPERDRTISFFHGKGSNVSYYIEGLWGYSSIPAGVHQAALELAKGFLCDDIEYRRRYIANIRAGDTRIEFHDNAYAGSTGNPIADAMLDPFRIWLMGAI